MSKEVSKPRRVRIVVDPHFGDRLASLPDGEPVWIVDSPANTPVAHRLWTQRPGVNHLAGITTFRPGADSAEGVLLGIIGTVDEHHAQYSTDTPYDEAEVIGVAPAPALTREFEAFGLTEFITTPGGFIASRGSRAELVEIDVGSVEGVPELHDKLAAALGFPAFYGRNWDAFWDAITGLVRMPRRLVVHRWRNVATRWPRDAKIMEDCLRDLNAQHPSWRCDYELRW